MSDSTVALMVLAGVIALFIWNRLPVGGAPVRAGAAFAAYALGFLAPGSEVQVLRSNRWTRLTAPGGHVLVR